MKWCFWRREKPLEAKSPAQRTDTVDMRAVPVNNPLDWREDGSIRRGDPAWDFFQEIMDSGQAGIANQRPDGTWETRLLEGDDERRR